MTAQTVLVIEDDPDLAEMMTWILTAAGFAVTTVCNGFAGLAALKRLPGCLVVLDLMMPGLDGIEFRARQRQDPAARRAPVLMVSAHHDAARVAASLQVDGFLQKPFLPDDLVKAVTRLIRSTSSQAS
jgi:DNA-binding response OmpR family regulator